MMGNMLDSYGLKVKGGWVNVIRDTMFSQEEC